MRVVVQRIASSTDRFIRPLLTERPFLLRRALLNRTHDALGVDLLAVAGAPAVYAAAGETRTRRDARTAGRGRLAARCPVYLDASRRQRRLPCLRAFAERSPSYVSRSCDARDGDGVHRHDADLLGESVRARRDDEQRESEEPPAWALLRART